jgi:hypothetical protein
VSISRNVRDPNYPLLASMVNTLNAYPLWGFPRRCVKLGHFDVDRNYQNQCTPYYTLSLEFEIWAVNDGTRGAVLGVSIADSGGGYSVGDVVTVVGGTGSDAATAVVVATSSGAVTAVFLVGPGSYSVLPGPTAFTGGGSGTGLQLNLFTGPGLTPKWDRDLNDEGTKALSGRWNKTTGAWDDVDVGGGPPDPLNPAHFIRYTDKLANTARVILDGSGRPYDPDHPPTTFVDKSMGFPFGGGREPPSSDTSGLGGAPTGQTATRKYGGGHEQRLPERHGVQGDGPERHRRDHPVLGHRSHDRVDERAEQPGQGRVDGRDRREGLPGVPQDGRRDRDAPVPR